MDFRHCCPSISRKLPIRLAPIWNWRGKHYTRLKVSRSINTMTFADGACEGRSRSEEEAMQGHRRRRETQRAPAISISPKGGVFTERDTKVAAS